jgi:fluoride exporter
MTKWLLLLVGGGLGALARYVFSGLAYQLLGLRFPFGTLCVNVFGCFLAGFVIILAEEKYFLSPNIRLFLLIGFLGAFTTFSTYILESVNLFKDGEMFMVFINLFGSLCLGLLFFYLGIILGRAI